MVNGQSSSSIFVQDGERGTRHTGTATQPGDETFDEGRFTAAQVSLESQNRSYAAMLCESPPNRFRLSRTVGNERIHLVIFDFRFSIFDCANQFESVAHLVIFFASSAPGARCCAVKLRRAIRNLRLQ